MVMAKTERGSKEWSEEEIEQLRTMASTPSDAYVMANTILAEREGRTYYYPEGEEKREDELYTESMTDGGEILQLTPNPIEEVLYLSNRSQQSCHLAIYDVNGKQINSYTIDGLGDAEIITSSYSPGIYLIKCHTADGKALRTYKLIKADK